jgi:hypothetical protein
MNNEIALRLPFAITFGIMILADCYLFAGMLIAGWQANKLYPATFSRREAALCLLLMAAWPLYPWLIAWWPQKHHTTTRLCDRIAQRQFVTMRLPDHPTKRPQDD